MAEKADWEETAKQEKRQLALRAGVAAVVIVTMLSALVFWERSNQEAAVAESARPKLPSPSEVRSAIQSAPVVEKISEVAQSAPEETVVEASEPATRIEQKDEAIHPIRPLPAASAPAPKASPVLPAPPLVQAQPAAKAAPVAAKSAPVVTRALPPAALSPRSAPQLPVATPAPAPRPAPKTAQTDASRLRLQQEVLIPAGELPPEGKAFALQVGVFANARNAEELRARLTLAGIPSQAETRVHVGPFRTRSEAAAALAKLKALGLDRSQLVLVKP
ncbi:SPOR domain-containing protein [Niveibacterium terrae]|uniref:SPOR domain-containing protein n=1 Tax=Niveibacterium terrae TaxID=3373598 RepID=UPI003A948999